MPATTAKKPTAAPAKATKKGDGPDFQAAINALPDALRTETLRFSFEIDQLKEDDIRKRAELGKRLLKIRDDASGQYGDDPIKSMGAVMPLSKDGLRPLMILAETYDDAELTQLLSLRHPVTQERLTWTHIMSLTRVRDKGKALRLAEQTVAEGWTSRDLNRKIIQAHGGPKSKGGRKAKKVSSFRDCVADIVARSTTWVNACDDVWTAADGLPDQYDKLASVPGYKPDQAVSDMLEQANDVVLTMQFKLAGLLQQMNNVKHRVDAARTARPTA